MFSAARVVAWPTNLSVNISSSVALARFFMMSAQTMRPNTPPRKTWPCDTESDAGGGAFVNDGAPCCACCARSLRHHRDEAVGLLRFTALHSTSQHFTALHSETVFWQKPRRFLARHQKPSSRIEPERWLARMPVPRSTSGMMLLHSAESELFEDASTGDAHTFVIELARSLGRSDGQQTGGQWALDVVDEDDSAAGGIAVFGDDNLC